MESLTILMLLLFTDAGSIIAKPTPFPNAAACEARLARELERPRRGLAVLVCVPPGAAMELDAAPVEDDSAKNAGPAS